MNGAQLAALRIERRSMALAVFVGTHLDYTQARYWTRQAALQGHEQAMRELRRREYRDP